MATADGTLNPLPAQTETSLTPGKRKRVSSVDEAGRDLSTLSGVPTQNGLHQSLKDLLQLLSKYDSNLGLLKCPLPPRSNGQPDSKRAKLSESRDPSRTIESQILSDQYRSIQEVSEDVETASTLVVESHQGNGAAENGSRSPKPAVSMELVNRARVFKKHLDNFILRNPVRDSPLKVENVEPAEINEAEKETKDKITLNPRDDKMVLTLFGNAPRGRQLFSGLQQPSSSSESKPIDEAKLPNGITSSKVVPFNILTRQAEKKKVRTFGEVFAPRRTLPALERPRSKSSAKTSDTVTWVNPYEAATSEKPSSLERKGYSFSPISSGRWLSYSHQPTVLSATARQNYQKYQPGHSGNPAGKPQNPLENDNGVFRGVYSSFAPSFDSSEGVVYETAMENLWWDKTGARRLYALLAGDRDAPSDEKLEEPSLNLEELDETTLEETVNSYTPETKPEPEEESKETENTKELDEILEDISDLLRTLNSYRQIRDLSLDSPALGKQTNEQPTDPVSPSTPSTSEISIYETLKSSLSTMIATLPPYAVSKLDGEQLAELNLSKKILMETPDFAGTMEEDEYTMQQRQAARMAQVPNATRTPAPPVNAARPTPYQTPQTAPGGGFQRGFPPNAQTKQIPAPHQASRNYGVRPPVQYTPGHSPQPYATRQQPQRPGYGQGQFPQPGTPQYNQAGILQQFQRASPNGAQQRMAQGSPQQYANQSQHNAHGSSPQRHQSFGTSQRQAYMNSTPNSAQPRYFQQQASQQPPVPNFPSAQSSPAPVTYSNSAAAMTYSRSAAEQAALMERNKAQIAEHQRRSSATPVQGRSFSSDAPQNGTPAP